MNSWMQFQEHPTSMDMIWGEIVHKTLQMCDMMFRDIVHSA